MKISGQWRKIFFSVGKTAIDVRGNSLWKLFSKREKFDLFSDSVRLFTSSKIFCRSSENRNLCIRGSFWGKTLFEIYIYNLSHFFRTLIQKTLSRKEIFFPGCHNCNPRIQRHFLRKSSFFEKNFVCSSVLVFEQLFLSTDKKLVRVSKKQPTNTEKSWRKKIVEKRFF